MSLMRWVCSHVWRVSDLRLGHAGLEGASAPRCEGPASASSNDRSWLGAQSSIRLFPQQLQFLLQLRYEIASSFTTF